MKKPQLLIIIIALLIVGVSIWGIMHVQAFLHNRKNPAPASSSLYTTGSQVIPTVSISAPLSNCDPTHIPTATDPAGGMGSPAIKPHLCRIPTFTQEDARQFMSTFPSFTGRRIAQSSAHFTVTRILFVTNQVANGILNADTGISNDTLVVCYIEVYGDFTVASPFASRGGKQATYHHGQMVFDGITGNMLVMGVVP